MTGSWFAGFVIGCLSGSIAAFILAACLHAAHNADEAERKARNIVLAVPTRYALGAGES